MNDFLMIAAAQDGGLLDMARSTGEAFGFHWSLFLSQMVSFIIVAFLLHRFAYKPILQVLEERRQTIAEGLANAERIKLELAQTEAARKEVLNQANTQANRLIEEARAAAAKVQETETQRAIAAAEQIIIKAREAAALDHAKMLTDLKREVAQLVIRTTANVTGKVLTTEDQRRLSEEANRQIAA
jgi:F-type H+-transporting ATPase subunit b